MQEGSAYLAIDIGGSKTLLAVFDGQGQVIYEQKIKTNQDYKQFLIDLSSTLQENDFSQCNFSACCCAVPGKIDRDGGIGITFGNLPWQNVPIKSDLEKLLPEIQVFIENDAILAGIYEAVALKDKYQKVLYLTISTGIGAGIISGGKLDPVLEDSEVGHMVFLHDGSLEKWEAFASGRALVKKYGKTASEIEDPEIWRAYAVDVAQGIDALLAVIQPEVVIIGGGVGAHLEKFQGFLEEELKKYQNNMVQIPPIIKAKKAEEAVIYGCYEYIRQRIS